MRERFTMGSIAAAALLVTSGAALAQTSPPGTKGALKLSKAECEALWKEADSAKSGALSQAEAQPYVSNFGKADADKNGKISHAEFLKGCDLGVVHGSAGTGAGSGGGEEAPEGQPPIKGAPGGSKGY